MKQEEENEGQKMPKIEKGGVCMGYIFAFLFGVISGMFASAFAYASGEADKRMEELNMKAGEQDGKEQQADKSI